MHCPPARLRLSRNISAVAARNASAKSTHLLPVIVVVVIVGAAATTVVVVVVVVGAAATVVVVVVVVGAAATVVVVVVVVGAAAATVVVVVVVVVGGAAACAPIPRLYRRWPSLCPCMQVVSMHTINHLLSPWIEGHDPKTPLTFR